jgi:hypothetical protein
VQRKAGVRTTDRNDSCDERLRLTANDRSALFIKLSRNCGSALEQTSSDSRSTGVLRFGVFHAYVFFIKGRFSGRIVV